MQAIKKSIAFEVIQSAQGTFEGDAVNREEYGAVFDASTKNQRSSYDVCIRKRPNGCT